MKKLACLVVVFCILIVTGCDKSRTESENSSRATNAETRAIIDFFDIGKFIGDLPRSDSEIFLSKFEQRFGCRPVQKEAPKTDSVSGFDYEIGAYLLRFYGSGAVYFFIGRDKVYANDYWIGTRQQRAEAMKFFNDVNAFIKAHDEAITAKTDALERG